MLDSLSTQLGSASVHRTTQSVAVDLSSILKYGNLFLEVNSTIN